jgi:dynein heavy chain
MARICGDLAEVATVLDQFNKFLGPELADVTGDSESIDGIREQVVRLQDVIEQQQIDVFDRRYETTWGAVMVGFKERVEDIEASTHRFINSAFQKLRSAEGAFDLLQNFRNIQSRESINRQMMEKYRDIYTQYLSELAKLQQKFDENKHAPPLYKNFPPVAGAIAWARSLYERAKEPVLKFKLRVDVWESDVGQRVKEQYLIFARAVDKYVNEQFEEWRERVPHITTENLKRPILGPDGGFFHAAHPKRKAGDKAHGSAEPPPVVLPEPPFTVNFSDELKVAIREAKYLDRMGFALPEMALNVALQERSTTAFASGWRSCCAITTTCWRSCRRWKTSCSRASCGNCARSSTSASRR